jgi:hypothetical protein
MGSNQPLIPADECLNRDRLRRGKGQVVQGPAFALFASICIKAVSTVARAEEFSRLRMQPLSNCLKLLARNLSTQAKQLRALAMPFTLHTTAFIVIVAVFQMPLSISSTTRHGPQSQHNPTLTLFEIQMQQAVSRYLAEKHPYAETRRAQYANPHALWPYMEMQ